MFLPKFKHFLFKGGDSNSKRAKLDQETEKKVNEETKTLGGKDQEQHVDASKESTVGTSDVSTVAKTEKSGFDELPKELHEMKIKDEKSKNNNEKVFNVIHLFLTFLSSMPSLVINVLL